MTHTVDAQKFVLRDSAGRVRAELGLKVEKYGDRHEEAPALTLFGKDDTPKVCAEVSCLDEAPSITLFGKTGKPQIRLSAPGQLGLSPRVEVCDSNGDRRIQLYFDETLKGGCLIFGGQHEARVMLFSIESDEIREDENAAVFCLNNELGAPRARMMVKRDGTSTFHLWNKDQLSPVPVAKPNLVGYRRWWPF